MYLREASCQGDPDKYCIGLEASSLDSDSKHLTWLAVWGLVVSCLPSQRRPIEVALWWQKDQESKAGKHLKPGFPNQKRGQNGLLPPKGRCTLRCTWAYVWRRRSWWVLSAPACSAGARPCPSTIMNFLKWGSALDAGVTMELLKLSFLPVHRSWLFLTASWAALERYAVVGPGSTWLTQGGQLSQPARRNFSLMPVRDDFTHWCGRGAVT